MLVRFCLNCVISQHESLLNTALYTSVYGISFTLYGSEESLYDNIRQSYSISFHAVIIIIPPSLHIKSLFKNKSANVAGEKYCLVTNPGSLLILKKQTKNSKKGKMYIVIPGEQRDRNISNIPLNSKSMVHRTLFHSKRTGWSTVYGCNQG